MRNFFKFTYFLLLSVCLKAQIPTATFTGISDIPCTGKSITLSALSTATDAAFKWSVIPSRQVTYLTNTTSSLVTFSTSSAGTYTATVMLTTPNGSNTISRTFNILRSASASFNASLSGDGFPSELMLTNYSSNSTGHQWLFDGVADKDTSSTLTRTYSGSGAHTVALLALGQGGCNDISSYAFRLADSSGVTLPNVFSPNNDGVNDIYKPNARGLVSLNVWIYNRHGVIICSWDQINSFWDGHTTSGEPCDAGDYFVVMEGTGFDGQKYKLKTNLTLVR